ncbi:hypothetical protein [Arthrobacter globiformis]|uniref:hypothetical protein n=1 Tax=Arthrobacter globiformis TaxID=1665 RepID=UPI00277E9574|nr:hypothetical protein [Arthrobacter globiformis]MDQ0865808.1 exopolysaccharide biosynthesis predicted pyruvyl transferase EpsI [Arthrobacter globiformis]
MKNLRSSNEFKLLAQTIADVNQYRTVYFIPSPGNWGDALINTGTVQFLDSIGCNYETRSRAELLYEISQVGDDSILELLVIVGGGGGWCETWFSTRDFVSSIAPGVSRVLVLPTTYALKKNPGPDANVIYFSRDSKLASKHLPEALFCHDMAFFLAADVEQEPHTLPRLVALRADREQSPSAKKFEFSVDVSLLGDAFSPVAPLLQIVSRFEHVVSDRLHVAIAGCLLNKSVTLLPGNYEKSREVFAASISPHFPLAQFREWKDFDFWP